MSPEPRAYYCYVRAQRTGADVDDRLQELAARIRQDERARAEEWLASDETPWIK